MTKTFPLSLSEIQAISEIYPTPFYIYDELAIRKNAQELNNNFKWLKGFINYFAVKACPNPHIMKILEEEWMGMDCSSMAELILCEKIGINWEKIMFTSNNTPIEEYKKAKEMWAIINIDDISHIEYIQQEIGLPNLLYCRYNPWEERSWWNNIIWKPLESKYGMTKNQLFESYSKMKKLWVKRFWLHTMIVSNEKDIKYIIETASMLFSLVIEIKKKLNIDIEFINLGGGIWIPYKPEEKAIDYYDLYKDIDEQYKKYSFKNLRIVMECGRLITWPYWYLITKAIHSKNSYKNYIGTDASMANLMRPWMYNAYHHITVLNNKTSSSTKKYDIVWSLCENIDKFAIDRTLPEIKKWDYLVIHDTWAHGHAMWFQYNGKLRSAELLLKENWEIQKIRRAERLKDYFATLEN